MNELCKTASIPVILFLTILLAGTPQIMAQSMFIEEFTTTNYMDPANTSADWNTAQGILTHQPFQSAVLSNSSAIAIGCQRVTVAGSHVYAGAGAAGMHILRLDPDGTAILKSTINTSGYTRDIQVVGNLAYIADGLSGLLIYNISDPTSPSFVGSYNTADYAWDVAVAGNIAYIADSNSGVRVVNITDPALPTLVTSIALPGKSYSLVLDGNTLYVADGTTGLFAIDVTDPALPAIMGSYTTSGTVYDVVIEGNLAYVADSVNGLVVFDITNPGMPALVSSLGVVASTRRISIAGNRAYLTCSTSGTEIVDISDPSAPVSLTVIPTMIYPDSSNDVTVAGPYMYTAHATGGIVMTRIADFVSPYPIASATAPLAAGNSTDLCVLGDLAILADDITGLHTADISNPDQPQFLGSVDLGGAHSFAVDGDYAFVATNTGVEVVDISDPSVPVYAGTGNTAYPSYGIAISGDFAYTACGLSGIEQYDITDPTTPTFTSGIVPLWGSLYKEIAVAGDYAYITNSVGKLYVIDIKSSMYFVGNHTMGANCNDIEVSGSYLFLALESGGLEVLDISDPTLPTLVETYPSGYNITDIAIIGETAVVTESGRALLVLDISDPTAITLISSHTDMDGRAAVVLADDLAFVATSQGGLEVNRFLQSEDDLTANVGQSMTLPGVTSPVALARITPWRSGLAAFELSVDGGGNWQPATSGQWLGFDTAGLDLKWRSTLDYSPFNSKVFNLAVDWLYEHATITAIGDIPGDQGGHVRLEWQRSGRDNIGDAQQITEYAVYRQIDAGAKAVTTELDPSYSNVVREHALAAKSAGWDFVTTVPVRVQDEYAVVVPTLADSSITGGQHFSTFMISALTATPGVFFDSPADTGYSVDNLAPGIPQAIVASYELDAMNLDWEDAPETDFRYFRIYRDTYSGFVPGPENLVTEIATSAWVDTTPESWSFQYMVTAVDFAGNESNAGMAATATDVPGAGSVTRFALGSATPNPFNPSTVLSFELPVRAEVNLSVYDLSGRHITTLVQEVRDSGQHEVIWDGRDSSSGLVSSGMYLYRLQAGDFQQTKRMTLLK